MSGTVGADQVSVESLLDRSPMTRYHFRVWLLAAMGVMLDGFDFFIMGVAIPLIKADFEPTPFEVGLITAAAVVGAIFGAATIGRLTDRLGRRLVFKLDLVMFVVFALLSASAWGVWSLIVFRFFLGVGIGADYPISAAYVSEIAPSRHRSRLLVGAFAFQAAGQLLGIIVGLAVLNLYPEPNAWRWMLGLGVIPALVIVVLRRGVPESPRWLASVGRIHEACVATSQFVGRQITVTQITAYVESEETAPTAWKELFAARFRRRTVLTTVPWFLMDIATYGVGVFTPTIIAAIGIQAADSTFIADDIASTKGAAVVDLFLVVGFGLALLLINRVGHIKLQLTGFVAMTVGLLTLAVATSLSGGGENNLPLVFTGFAIFNLFMNMGPNSITFVLPAEIFPTEIRASGHGLAAAAGKTGAAVGLVVFPLMQGGLGLDWTLMIIAGGCVLAAIVTAVFRVDPRSPEPA